MADALAFVVHSSLSADGDGDAILGTPDPWTDGVNPFPMPMAHTHALPSPKSTLS